MKKIPVLHIVLFVLTFLSTLAVGAFHEHVIKIDDNFHLSITGFWDIFKGLPFAVSLMFILLAHELAHYRMSKKHHVEATLPYFLPAPTIFGTFGAFIKMRSPITTRNALMDIGASGPIVGFAVSVVATVIGLLLSSPASKLPPGENYVFGPSLLFVGIVKVVFGNMPDAGIEMHSIALAGWIGLFVTSLNLIPVGQLDGGHIAYALLGEKHVLLSKILIGLMLVMGFLIHPNWLIWAILLIILGYKHPPIIYPYIPLDPIRRKIGWASLLIFVLTFTPVPVAVM